MAIEMEGSTTDLTINYLNEFHKEIYHFLGEGYIIPVIQKYRAIGLMSCVR